MPPRKRTNKEALKRTDSDPLWSDETQWRVHKGKLIKKGRPRVSQSLFKIIAEKLPYDSLAAVAKDLREAEGLVEGVYIAHDSMGCPRYVGRGRVISRLRARKRENPLELEYFSFYIVEEKQHEREIETLLIRAAGPLLHFNDKKKRVDIEPGAIKDFEAGTIYYTRRKVRGA